MQYLSVILLGLSLSMDALAVAITIGICRAGIKPYHVLKVGVFFGGFQAIMPAIGWFAGISLSSLIKPFDHWVAFALLAFIGGKMIYETLHEEIVEDDDTCPREDPLGTKRLFILALATSIDALAAGISLAIDQTPIISSILTIGLITFVLSAAGVMLGKRLGVVFQKNATLAGGIILILIGLKVLIEHLVAA